MSVQTPSVHASVLRVQHPAAQAGGEVGRRLSSLLRLGAAVRGEEGERGAGGDGVGAAGVLLPQVLGDDAVEGRRGGEVALQLLLHGWSLRDGARIKRRHRGFVIRNESFIKRLTHLDESTVV